MAERLFVAEPAAPFAARTPMVIDCSVVAALLFYEPSRDDAAAILKRKELYAPDLLDHEFVNVAVKKARLGLGEVTQQALTDLERLPLARCRVDPRGQCRLSLELGISAYDAAYLWLAEDLGAPLATFDRRLGLAARRHLGGA